MNGNIFGNVHSNNSKRESTLSLIERARCGDQIAFSELKDQYTPLLESSVTRHKSADMTVQDIEDMRQEALIVFCNAVYNYRSSEDAVEFGLYAKICVDNGLASFVRSYLRRVKNSALPLDGIGLSLADFPKDPLQAFVDKENTAELVHSIKKTLSDYENRVWWLYVSGLSVSEIAKSLNIDDPKSVSNAIYRIRKKLRAQFPDKA